MIRYTPNTSEKISFAGTLVVWIILSIFFALYKPAQSKPKYKEVQIVISSTPMEKKVEEAPAPAAPAPAPAASVEAVETVQSPEPVVATPAPVVETKPAPAVTKTAPKPVETKAAAKPVEKKTAEPVALSKSVEDLMAEQFTNKKSTNNADYDPFAQFEDDDFEEETVQRTVNNNTVAYEGSAAQAATSTSKTVTATSAKTENKQGSSASTSNALGKISNAKFFGTASDSVDTEATVQTTASGNGKVAMVMANGSSRLLLEPAKPIINLSEAAAATIDGSRRVDITFTVTESGNVPRGDITITPESILSELVRKEIRDQISKWRFETADYVSKATFEYKIVKYN